MGEDALWQGVPRREVPWYPTVDYGLCLGCQSRFDFCSAGVFD
ncbi:MAG: hypothetical protein ACUVTG_14935 [Candidatus Oleimicrobiaceae bacterium]